MTDPRPCRQFRTPGGTPASSKISISSAPRIAEGSAGFMITVLPVTSAAGDHSAENRDRKIPRRDDESDAARPVMLVAFLAGNVLSQTRIPRSRIWCA